jgi:hypothetical protein
MTRERIRMKTLLLIGCAVALCGLAPACHRDPPPEGPAQRAGEKVDNAASDTKDAVKDSAHDVKHDMQK